MRKLGFRVRAWGDVVRVLPALLLVGMAGCGDSPLPSKTKTVAECSVRDGAIAEFNKGFRFNQRVEWAAAIDCYTEAIRLVPDYVDANHNRAIVYGQAGKYALAIKDLSEAIHWDPNYVSACRNRGVVYQKQGDQAKANADFAKAKK